MGYENTMQYYPTLFLGLVFLCFKLSTLYFSETIMSIPCVLWDEVSLKYSFIPSPGELESCLRVHTQDHIISQGVL